jgi:poly(A) polymerase
MNTCKRIIHRSEHVISRKNIDQDAVKVLYRLSRYGYTAHLVGGGVRDLLLGRTPKDFDISTDASPREIKKLFRNCMLIGRRFRLAHIRFGPKIIETSTFRRQPETEIDPQDPDADLFHRSDNTFGTPEEDAWRRDFTINGLFYDIKSFSVIDYVGGLEDLENKLIRSIGDPDLRFREDPVRMLRAVRFASRLGFGFEQETMAAIRRHHEEITKAAPQRVLEEILRLFGFSSGASAIRLLRETGLLADLFPEIERYLLEHGGGEAPMWRYLAALDEMGRLSAESPTPALILGSLLFDPLQEAMADALRKDPGTPEPFFLNSMLEPLAVRFQIPKRILFRIIPMLMYQKRFDPERRSKFSKAKFIKQESFAEALLLREIHLLATGGDLSALDSWKEFVCQRTEDREARAHAQSEGEFRFEEAGHGGRGGAGTPARAERRPRSGHWRGRRRKSNDSGVKAE